MARILSVLGVLALVASVSSGEYTYPPGVPVGASWVELVEYTYISDGPEAGNWEYIYDAWGGASSYFKDINIYFDRSDLMVNVYPNQTHNVKQIWAAGSQGLFGLYGSYAFPEIWPSNWVLDMQTFEGYWELNEGVEWGMLNRWHAGNEYICNEQEWRQGDTTEAGINFHNVNSARTGLWMQEGLSATIRVVHPYGPGDITYATNNGGSSGTLIGPAIAPVTPALGDLDEDFDVDADDIDLMGEYIRTGVAPTTANYDLSDTGTSSGTDGSVTILDLDYLVRFLVETSAVNGDGDPIFGTQYGDFNLDGEIELGDLTRLGTYYGIGTKWFQGNANPHLDTDIELGDLTILGTYYGASNGGVDAIPEPMTMSLLAVGAVAILRRRGSQIRRGGK